MRKLSLNLIILIAAISVWGQENPHGEELTLDCADCHTVQSWKYVETGNFDHSSTNFNLEGQHLLTDCRECHTSLVFSEAGTSCADCHTDMHNSTVGNDCARCHTPRSWIVTNITELHQLSRFPLLGAHNTADCASCHVLASQLEFEPLGVECIDCHNQDYLATTSPNHVEAGFSKECIECHKIDAFDWLGAGINHDFFPLTKGHAINECAECHTSGISATISPDCYSCHQNNYIASVNPSHQNLGLSTNCMECHTTDPGWKPADFKDHDAISFPIYSGEHKGEWNSCFDCHKQPENYSLFSCIDCHEHNKTEMDNEHSGMKDYEYNSQACFACHPTGDGEGSFDHNTTGFILKGAHIAAICSDCHTDSYSNTSSECKGCHSDSYALATEPNHVSAGISNDCATCHTENGWSPSIFDHTVSTGFALTAGHSGRQCADCHQGTTSTASSECISCHQADFNRAENHVAQNFPSDCLQCHSTESWEGADFDHNTTSFPLNGAHIATECTACHTSGYAGTPNQCFDCHQADFDGTTEPNHLSAHFSTHCETCHSETSWIPSTFDHDNQYFPINSGPHRETWSSCLTCHIDASNYSVFSCTVCHEHSQTEMDQKHNEVSGYAYNSISCFDCHPNGRED